MAANLACAKEKVISFERLNYTLQTMLDCLCGQLFMYCTLDTSSLASQKLEIGTPLKIRTHSIILNLPVFGIQTPTVSYLGFEMNFTDMLFERIFCFELPGTLYTVEACLRMNIPSMYFQF